MKIAAEVWRRHVVTAAEDVYGQSKFDAFGNPQPVQVTKLGVLQK